jgi:O-antigen/teichoic acid export membrane protein
MTRHRRPSRGGARRPAARLRSELVTRAARSAAGQLASALGLFVLTIVGATTLGDRQYAMWVLLTAVASVTMSLDLGASSYAAALYDPRAGREARVRVMLTGNQLNLLGSALIGAVCVAGWFVIGDRIAPAGWTTSQGLWAIFVMIVGCTLRGSTVVAAQAAMAAHDFRLRDELLVGQTAVAVTAVWILAERIHSAWVFPISYGLVSLPFAIYGWVRLTSSRRSQAPGAAKTGGGAQDAIDYRRIARQFAARRTASTLALAILTQADRWVLAGVASAAVLGTYEVCWRLASIPRVAITSLTTYLIPHGAALGRDDERQAVRVVVRGTLAGAAFGTTMSILVFLGAYSLGLAPRHTPAWLLLLLLTSLTLNGLTSPTSNIAVGRGQPGIDLRYLVPALLGSIIVWVAGSAAGDYHVVVLGSTLPMIASCLAFITFGPRLVARRFDRPILRPSAPPLADVSAPPHNE